MESLLVTAKDLTKGVYSGDTDLTDFQGHIVIAKDLGHVKASGRIDAHIGSGIHAHRSLTAGKSISSDGIFLGRNIPSEEYILAMEGIDACGGVEAEMAILSARDIKAGGRITAGSSIEAGNGISAGKNVLSGLAIEAKWIDAKDHIFAGVGPWRTPDPEEMEVRAEIRSGKLILGIHVPPEAK